MTDMEELDRRCIHGIDDPSWCTMCNGSDARELEACKAAAREYREREARERSQRVDEEWVFLSDDEGRGE